MKRLRRVITLLYTIQREIRAKITHQFLWAKECIFFNYLLFLVADSWNPTSIGVKVLRGSVLEVVDRDGLCVRERIIRRHQEVRLAYRKQLVFDAFWFPENLYLHRIEDLCVLQSVPALRKLTFFECQEVRDLTPLLALPSLEELEVFRMNKTEVPPELKKRVTVRRK